jgi:hypothetical protein
VYSSELTAQVLADLRAPRTYPAVSLTMPTHRREPDNIQDPVRLRTLVTEAKRQVDADPAVDRAVRLELHRRLDLIAGEADLRHALDGLVVFVSTDEHQLWYVAHQVPERVVLSDSYLTRNLVAAHAHAEPYWVLCVAADRATLWHGSDENLRESRDHGFPMTVEPWAEENDVQRKERVGDVPNSFSSEQTRSFFRAVNTAMAELLHASPDPLYLVGLAEALTLLEETGDSVKRSAGHTLTGGLVNGPGRALHEALHAAFDERSARIERDVADRLDRAAGRGVLAAGLDEVWRSALDARAGLVTVEEHYQQDVLMTGEHLEPVTEELTAAGTNGARIRTDIVDEIVEKALAKGADVVFVPDDALADRGRIAAVLRH